jgi:predicted homoserine dehydrogenase-like protein
VIIVDNALKAREKAGKPIRVGQIGAGFMGQGLVNQIVHFVKGECMVAIYNRHVEKAVRCFAYAGLKAIVATNQSTLEDAIRSGSPVVTEDPYLLTRSEQIDCLVDVTGAVEFGARIVLDAFKHKKHVVLMNAELDATIGPILQVYARKYGVIISACDGDQPGVEINLHRYVAGLGLIPRVVGNIKGLQDRYRNPTTQKGFAEKWGQSPSMVTSFADGSKVSFEQAIVANACGLQVKTRGMSRGYVHNAHVDSLTKYYDVDELRQLGGIVDYVVGAQPSPGVYCIAEHTDPKQRHYLNLYKLGEGPLYSFYTPYHLCHFEVPNTVARVVLFSDANVPLDGPRVEVCACAKKDLTAGEELDEYGHYMTYGEAVNTAEMRSKRYLPEGLVEGCKLKRNIAKDEVISYDDVELPAGRIADELRIEQYAQFGVPLFQKHDQ